MDINEQDVFEDFELPQKDILTEDVLEPTSRILPDGDYNKKGEVKKVRGRMLKKLLKYEMRALLTWLYICLGVLGGITVLVCILLNLPLLHNENAFLPVLLITLLYIYSVIAAIFTPFFIAVNRYHKNFFKEEGYLTFSIPASMEEHVLAKHISGLIAVGVGFVAGAISLVLVYWITPASELLDVIGAIFPFEPFSTSMFFEILETVIIGIAFFIFLFCGAGALNCWGQKFNKKGSIIWRILLVYVICTVISSLWTSLFEEAMLWLNVDSVGIHVGNCLTILLYAGLTVFSVWYELRFLKRKLNLK